MTKHILWIPLLVLVLATGCQPVSRLKPSVSPETGLPSLPAPATKAVPGAPEVTVAAVGDIMLGRRIASRRRELGGAYPFDAAATVFGRSDMVFGNLESPLCDDDQGSPVSRTKEVLIRAPLDMASLLGRTGFTVLSLANNHALDYREACLEQTLEALQAQGIGVTGVFRRNERNQEPLIVERNGIRIAWLAFSAVSPDEFDSPQRSLLVSTAYQSDVTAAVRRAKARSDIVIVSMHWGWEYQEALLPYQLKKGRAAVDAGADVVIGHHPHILQGVEAYGKGLIFYSLGNFVFDIRRPAALESLAVRLTFTRQGAASYELVPLILKDGAPVLAEGADKDRILERVRKLSGEIGKEAVRPVPAVSSPVPGSVHP